MSLQKKLKARRSAQVNPAIELPEDLADGQALFARSPTLADLDWIQEHGSPEVCMLSSCRMIARCVVDGDGKRVFSDIDAELVLHQESNPADISAIGQAMGAALKSASVSLGDAEKN